VHYTFFSFFYFIDLDSSSYS